MKNEYIDYKNITRNILDNIKVGNIIKCNDWEESMKVVGISDNYFIMVNGDYYSICEKKPIDHTRNNYTKGSFRIGDDDLVFGKIGGYKWNDEKFITEYLNELESGETQLSARRAIDLKKIKILYLHDF